MRYENISTTIYLLLTLYKQIRLQNKNDKFKNYTEFMNYVVKN